VAILALSISGYSVALLYILFGAPDLAMTQFAVETLTLILLVIVLIHLPGIEGYESVGTRVRDGIVALGVGTIVTTLAFTALSFPLDRSVSEFMAENSYTVAQGTNIVNVILVDMRGVDTMGEIIVLCMAALGVYVLMRMPRTPDPDLTTAAIPTADAPDSAGDAAGDGSAAVESASDGAPAEEAPASESEAN
jgi:multicomponent Na+:H+ antiporter subunit A